MKVLIERFKKSKCIRKSNGCIEWVGSKNLDGYGKMKRNSVMYLTHRLSYQIYNGPIPEGMLVQHTCDNPPCINPNHLELGTKKTNRQDCATKNRCNQKGNHNNRSKLTDEEVTEIREYYDSGLNTQQELSDIYDTSVSNICSIINRSRWKHV